MANQPSTNQDAIQGDGDNTKGAADKTAPLLALKGLDKRFGATHALKAVDLIFEAGKIYAIVGENRAGKSALIQVLTGSYPRAGGDFFLGSRPVALPPPREAIQH